MFGKKIFCVVLFLCLLCSFSYAQKLGVQGVVYDATTGEVLQGAELKINETERFEITNEAGRYLFSDLKKGTYTIMVSYMGYAPQTKKVTLNNKSATLHFQLKEMSTELDEVVVTGTGTMHHIQAVPLMTEVIGKKFLSMYSGQSLQEILAGLSPSFDYNEGVMGANIQMNGLGSKYILILVNGERISSEQNVLGLINPAEIEKIEIVKGASSSLYGSDAIAGVVNIITKKEKAKYAIQNSTRYANYNTLHQSNKVSLSAGKFRSTTRFNLKKTDGWQNTTEEISRSSNRHYKNSVTKTVNSFTDWKVGQKIAFQPNKKFSANIEGSFYKKEITRPSGYPQYVAYGMEYQNQSYSARAKYKLNDRLHFTLNGNYNQTEYFHNYIGRDFEKHIKKDGTRFTLVRYPGERTKEKKKERFIVNGQVVYHRNKKETRSAGFEMKQDKLTSENRLPSGKEANYTLSAYLQEEYNLTENFNLTGGLRFTKHEVFGLNVAPKISILKKWEHFNVRASWSLGFKTPELNELHYRYKRDMMGGLKLFLGNKDLKPETSNYFSLATEYKTTDFSITASAYLNKLKDMITLIGIPTPYAERDRELDKTLQYRNVENATIKGIELMTKYNLPYNIKVGGSYSFLDAKGNFLNEDEEIENRIINYTSKHKGSLYALWNHSWQKYGFGVGVFGKGQSKRYHYEYGDADAYMLFRLNTEHKFMHFKNCNIEVNAGIDNILDYKETKPYGYHYATTTPGRTFYVSLFINFKK